MSKLLDLMKRLGKDADLEAAYKLDREGVARQAGCNDEEVQALLNKDYERISQLTGLKNGQFATNLTVKSYDR
jgi:hypothetical protein